MNQKYEVRLIHHDGSLETLCDCPNTSKAELFGLAGSQAYFGRVIHVISPFGNVIAKFKNGSRYFE